MLGFFLGGGVGVGESDQLFADFRFPLGILEHKLCENRNTTLLHLFHCNIHKYARRIKFVSLMHDLVNYKQFN